MSDQEFGHAAGDPLPDRLKQYLSDLARRELDALRADLEMKLMALETALAHPDQHDSLETLVFDLARAATVEAEAAASRAMLDAQVQSQHRSGTADALRELDAERAAVMALQNEIDELRRRADTETARSQAEQADLENRLAAARREADDAARGLQEAQRQIMDAQREAREARQMADARAADFTKGREAAGAAQVEAAARLKTLEDKVKAAEAAKADAERIRREAVNRAETAEVFARETAARASNAEAWGKDLETRRKEAEARAAREESRLQEAESRAAQEREAIAKERETFAKERETFAKEREALDERFAPQTAKLELLEAKLLEYEKQLAAADERYKALELRLFQRDRSGPDRDEDLSGLLTPAPAAPRPSRIATRYTMGDTVKADVGGQVGTLVDLSTRGAQVLSPVPLQEGAEVDVRLLSDEVPFACRGRIVWTRLEPKSSPHGLRHRAGILFTQRDVGAVEAFIIRYAMT